MRFLFLCFMLMSCGPPLEVGDSLTLGLGLEPPGLDPTSGAAAATDEVVYANVFEGLTRIDRHGRVQPALARSWTVSDDGRVYVFQLAQNVVFHNGTPFAAKIAKFALERTTAPGSTNAQQQLFAGIQSVEAPNPHKLRITLKAPNSEFLFNLGWGDAVMVEPSSASTNASNPIGTGPYRFTRWLTGTAIMLARFDGYWGEVPALEHVTFKFIGDPGAVFGAIMAGDVDGFPLFGAPELLPQIERTGRFKVTEGMTEGETILAMNNARAPFNDIRVRKAITHAIDRQAIIDGAMFGFGPPIGTFFSPMHPDYLDLTAESAFDPVKAKALLAEAGYPNGFETTLVLPPTGYARQGGEIIAAQLRAIGIRPKMQAMEWAQWLDRVLANKSYDMTIVSHTEPADIGFFARPDNYFGYQSDTFNAQLAAKDYKAAQRQLAADAPVAFLFQLPQIGVWDKRLRGQWESAPVQANDVTAISWVQTP